MTARRGDASPAAGRLALLFLAGLVLVQLAWIWTLPPFRGIDEVEQSLRASSVALGDIRPTRLPVDGRGALVEVPASLAEAAKDQCTSLAYTGVSNCFPTERLANGHVIIASSATVYSPVAYWLYGTPSLLFDSGVGQLWAMRVTAALVNAVLLALAAWSLLRVSRSGWPLAGLVVGLTPMATFTTVLPAPNGLELSAATLLWCALLALQHTDVPRVRTALIGLVGLAGATLGAVRLTGPVFVLLIVLFTTLLAPRRTWTTIRRHWRAVLAAVVVTTAGTLYQVHWVYSHGPVRSRDDSVTFKVGLVLEQALLWPFQAIGAFPFRDEPTSMVTYALCGTAIILLLALGARRRGAARWVALLVLVVCEAVPLMFTWMTIESRGLFWQGRYGLGVLVGIPLILTMALDRGPTALRRPDRLLRQALVVMCGAAGLFATVDLMHKQDHWWASREDPDWHRPGVLPLVVVYAAATVLLAIAVRRADSAGLRAADHPAYPPDAEGEPGSPDGESEHRERRHERTHVVGEGQHQHR